jgi:hypothetical protein
LRRPQIDDMDDGECVETLSALQRSGGHAPDVGALLRQPQTRAVDLPGRQRFVTWGA